VDAQARRIGVGKGMYDRFFATLNRKPKTIFVQLEACLTNKKICDDYDVSADVLLTPSARYEAARTTYDKRNTLRRRYRHR
ncbi:MAG: 5-formyltetrahydrofolate cyclo-ligase, partial [Campylobacterales bacterium]